MVMVGFMFIFFKPGRKKFLYTNTNHS